MPRGPDDVRLTRNEISRLVYKWMGVSDDGYLGKFSYSTHDRFWLEVCDMAVDTAAFRGTTRACFIETLYAASTRDQALALRQILKDYPALEGPIGDEPNYRSIELRAEIEAWVTRLETGRDIVAIQRLLEPSESVRHSLADAESLLRTRGPQSAVDRVHTALHGYLFALCAAEGVTVVAGATLSQLFKALRTQVPSFMAAGGRAADIDRMSGAMASILDALSPIRNNASPAHPTDELVGEPEAMLAINAVRTVLNYLEAKRSIC